MNNKFKRKLNKLVKNPDLFLKDMYFKHSTKWKKTLNVKHDGTHHFTIVTAVYNVEKYLDDFFDSIVKQSLNFKKHIQIICVDDGSTDNSAAIIKKWKKNYPDNIHYFYKENGGQASARNLGLEHVQTEWVTFIDPDDFISADYFQKIDNYLNKEKDIALIGCPLVFYFEDKKIFKDTHPLKYRFANGNTALFIEDLKNHLQLSASTAIFKIKEIRKSNLFFDEEMKPSFEDAKFVTDYILNANRKHKVGFISDISYFYRKRDDGSSTLDGAWKNPLLFSRVLEKGCIGILEDAKSKFGTIPEHIQRIALYHIIWYFGRIVNNPNAVSHLTDEQKENFVELLFKIFSYIDEKTILRFNLAGTWWFQKVALLGLFKEKSPNSQIAYIEDFDLKKDQVLIKYYSNFNELTKYVLDDKNVLPTYQKEVTYDFLGHLYTKEYRSWISVADANELSFYLNNKIVKLTFAGKQYDKLGLKAVRDAFAKKSTIKNDAWIFIDRDNQADDNAEHLYRYVNREFPSQKIYFALNESSSDWDRLKSEGFNLLAFGSSQFEKELRDCSKIISSHIDGYITHYFKDNSLEDKDYIFLQHGITKDDLSSWLNTKKINILVTATEPEYNSIQANGTAYKFGKKEVQLTGFPRYDNLLKGNVNDTKQILIMPTWRSTIVGEYISGTKRKRNPDFMKTNYAIHWHNFVNSKLLEQVYNQGYKIVFAPHPSVQEYMDEFTVPDYISIYKYSEGNIQALFQQSSILITDYSSVAFDVAYLNKAILYYQFDYDDVFGGASHTYKKGYFSYDKDAFGSIARTEEQLLLELEKLVDNQGKSDPMYVTRINKTFAFRDENNCERVYRAIKALDEPDSQELDTEIVANALQSAYEHKAWDLVESRSAILLEIGTPEQQKVAKVMHFEALMIGKKNKEQAEQFLSENPIDEAMFKKASLDVALSQNNWVDINRWLSAEKELSVEQQMRLLQSNIMLEQFEQAKGLQKVVENLPLSDEQALMLKLWEAVSNEDWQAVIEYQEQVDELSLPTLRVYLPQLLLARAYRKLELFEKAHSQLVAFEKHSAGLFDLRIEIAKLALAQQNYGKAIGQLEKAFNNDIEAMNENMSEKYFSALWLDNKVSDLTEKLPSALVRYPSNEALRLLAFNVAIKNSEWQEALDIAQTLATEQKEQLLYPICLSYYRLGQFEELDTYYVKPTMEHSYEYWELIAEFALLMGNTKLSKDCYRTMIARFPNNHKQQNLAIFSTLSK
ncbi:CDP-glycerol glycerophosphotransferase family protein [Actinobacillus genomosp. 2]|uniref:CDP-glycerol glycerophosphotransferase family protein n=1 Tax=Actinobacillus genomosp. 2 TaxID=230709 RepID=UPI002441D096|nr:CDP-glycerol glycerophosphotransferase family protein [Actinobacillus genomosp. 2]WGE31758.1 CDP-glycerol glycerophosphotransferase family protein [Actinobacillus genomosp. 2]